MWLKERWKSPVPFRSWRKEGSSLRPCFDRSIGRVFFFTLIGACLMLIYWETIASRKEPSPIVVIQAAIVTLATFWVFFRLLGSAALRRRFRTWRLELEGTPIPRGREVAWTLVAPKNDRPPDIKVERICREAEKLYGGADGNSSRWDRSEGQVRGLSPSACPEGWQGMVIIHEEEPGQADQEHFWRQWLIRVTVGKSEVYFPLPDSLTDTQIREPQRYR
jgi:hypothetical protein